MYGGHLCQLWMMFWSINTIGYGGGNRYITRTELITTIGLDSTRTVSDRTIAHATRDSHPGLVHGIFSLARAFANSLSWCCNDSTAIDSPLEIYFPSRPCK